MPNSVQPSAGETAPARTAEVFRAAARLMVEKGYGATSIGDIAQAVGMTKAGLYHHISSKQDMLFQIMQQAMDWLERIVIEPAKQLENPEERLRAIIRLHVSAILDHGVETTLVFQERRHLDSSQRAPVTKRLKGYRRLISETLRELADAGKLNDLDIHIATRHIMQTIIGVARWYPADPEKNDARIVEQTVQYNMSAILKQ